MLTPDAGAAGAAGTQDASGPNNEQPLSPASSAIPERADPSGKETGPGAEDGADGNVGGGGEGAFPLVA